MDIYSKENKLNILFYLYSAILVLLNFIRIFDNSFWYDEAYSIWIAKYNLSDLIQITAQDVHPPLYYLILKLFVSILGGA